jgi:cobalamin biosynthesis Mg chelatase CobN
MRARLLALMVAALAGSALFLMTTSAHASVNLAQTEDEEGVVTEEDESSQGEGGNEGEGTGQSDPEAETGADEGETAEGESTEEEGPPWTYQMARIGIVLMLLVGGLIGLMYYRMIVQRQKGGI